ncbi:unnamed protein product [Pleuronectes platessa]|uniref:Uncharacterized protein n=1 Tax=Pleuronectes platessa TaxID=8262 RepID=A0A9N7UV53_PLEPL|nr:unnamed protein product [Pleuronectes platessa]
MHGAGQADKRCKQLFQKPADGKAGRDPGVDRRTNGQAGHGRYRVQVGDEPGAQAKCKTAKSSMTGKKKSKRRWYFSSAVESLSRGAGPFVLESPPHEADQPSGVTQPSPAAGGGGLLRGTAIGERSQTEWEFLVGSRGSAAGELSYSVTSFLPGFL